MHTHETLERHASNKGETADVQTHVLTISLSLFLSPHTYVHTHTDTHTHTPGTRGGRGSGGQVSSQRQRCVFQARHRLQVFPLSLSLIFAHN